MFRSRGENLRSVFILLFLYVAFFLLEHDDPEKYARLFSFNRDAVMHGEWWRVLTWQFSQAGQGWMEALSLFVTLLLVYTMGGAIEEDWGTRPFLTLFVLSTGASAAIAAWTGVPLLGTYFVYFTLLFVYASAFPHRTFYLMGAIPVRVRLLALFSFAVLVYGVFAGGMANLAALGGAVIGYLYYASHRVRPIAAPAAMSDDDEPSPEPIRIDTTAIHNGARHAAIKQMRAAGDAVAYERLLGQCERDVVPNVNICPPADFKPDDSDGYCIRCEGFAECSARALRAHPVKAAPAALAMPATDAP
ncbi:MAG TPA: rhomboid family intramembrane serine protease [Thermoanaerobaculia bacterium]|jgi:membrane associated rhomboid family serine protease